MYEELKIYNKDIDINFTRISKPDFNSIDLPLSGLYNNIDSVEYPNYPLKNKFKNFSITSKGAVGVDNLFQLKNSFDKLLTEEILEGIITLTNNSSRDITIKNLEITLIFEKQQKTLNMTLPDKDNTLLLSQKKSYSIKIKNYLKKKGKYSFDIKFRTRSLFYDQQYYLLKQKAKIKESNKYKIIDNHVEYYNNKIFNFNVSEPFEIKAKFKMNQIKEEYFIEINIKNISNYYLTIPDLIITPKQRNNIYLKPFSTLQEMQMNLDRIYDTNDKTGNKSNKMFFLNNTRIISLQPDEELNLLFKNDSREIFLFEEKFILFIKWLKIFDFSPKNFEYEFNNELDIFNKYFFCNIIERPKGNIILGQNFPVIIQFNTKQPNQNLELVISEYDSNNRSEKDIDILIKEYKFELNNINQKFDIHIICKSDKIGLVKFPKIMIELLINNENNEKYIYKDLLCFNCVENVQLI